MHDGPAELMDRRESDGPNRDLGGSRLSNRGGARQRRRGQEIFGEVDLATAGTAAQEQVAQRQLPAGLGAPVLGKRTIRGRANPSHGSAAREGCPSATPGDSASVVLPEHR